MEPKQIREFLGLNMVQMAHAMGIDIGLWKKWEYGTQRITAAPIRLLTVFVVLKKDGILERVLKTVNEDNVLKM